MPSAYKGTDAEIRALSAFITLMRASDALAARLHRELARHGLTISQFGALEALLHLGPLFQGDLAAKLLRSGGSITACVAGLERRGLVARERTAQDRRFVRVSLTPRGKALIARLFPRHARLLTRLMAALPPGDQDELRRLCRALGTAAAP